jgi:hypothetical protein
MQVDHHERAAVKDLDVVKGFMLERLEGNGESYEIYAQRRNSDAVVLFSLRKGKPEDLRTTKCIEQKM